MIAEAGVAHFGSLETARKLVDMAVDAKANAVKFQLFNTESLISRASQEWIDRLKPKELSYENATSIKEYCDQKGIMFLATPHEESSSDFLEELGVPAFKVGSGEVGNLKFIRHLAKKGKPILVSTGLHNDNDIAQVLSAIAEENNPNAALFHCVTAYPTPPEQSNLNAIKTMMEEYPVPVGYSDHTVGTLIPLASIALGAQLLEKHICIDKQTPGSQDCKVSCDREDLIQMVDQVRRIESSLGNGKKLVAEAAKPSIAWARKSLVAARSLRAGETLKDEDIVMKRPGTGILPTDKDKVIGLKLVHDIAKDELFSWSHFEEV